jgi:hypothetical protein
MFNSFFALKKVPQYFHVLLKVALFTIFGFTVEKMFSLSGRCINSLFLVVELGAVFYLLKVRKQIQFSRGQYWLFLFFHILIFLADFGYTWIYYFLGFKRPNSFHTAYLCATFGLSFLSLAGFFWASFDLGQLKKYSKSYYVVILVTIILVATFSLSSPLWMNSKKTGLLFVGGESIVLGCSYILFYIASLIYISATDYFWNLVSSGTIIMLAGDWTMKTRKFSGMDVALIPESYLWGLGVFTLCFCVYNVNNGAKKLQFIDIHLESAKSKVVSFGLAVVLFTIQNFLFWGNEYVIRNLTWCLIFTIIANAAYDTISVSDELSRRGKTIANQKARLEMAASNAHSVGTSVRKLAEMITEKVKPTNAALATICLSELNHIEEFAEETFRDRWLQQHGATDAVQKFPVRAHSLLQELKRYKTGIFEKQGFVIECDFDDLGSHCRYSPKILIGLLDNCIRNAQLEGATKVVIRKRSNEIQITDNGRGFDAKTALKVFCTSSVSAHHGHGEGLHLSKKWLNSWGGDIWISSEANPTTISIRLLEALKIKKVALVDDQTFYHDAWDSSARKFGVELLTYSTLEAFEQAFSESHSYDDWLICIDDKLGNTSGQLEMGRLKKKFLNVILTTAVPQKFLEIECRGKTPIWEESPWY